jgi:hypothetical protein
MIFICFTMVDLPLSPEPADRQLHALGDARRRTEQQDLAFPP